MEHRGISSLAANPTLPLSLSLLHTPPELLEHPAQGWKHPQLLTEGSQAPERELGRGNSLPKAHCCILPASFHSHKGTSPTQGAGDDLQSFLWEGNLKKAPAGSSLHSKTRDLIGLFILVYTANCCRCIGYHEIKTVVKPGVAKN